MSQLDALDETSVKNARKRERRVERKTETEPKEPKPKTWEVTWALYQAGKSPKEIAAERGLVFGTVFGHLGRYVLSGQLPLDALISPDRQQTIKRVINMVGTDQGTTPIKALCPEDIDHAEIRLMIDLMRPKS